MTEPHLATNAPTRHHWRDQQWGLPARVTAVLEAVAHRHGVTVYDILGRSRRHVIVPARQAACAELRDMVWGAGNPALEQIGAWLGLDHTTVLHGIRAHRVRRWAPYREAISIYLTGRP